MSDPTPMTPRSPQAGHPEGEKQRVMAALDAHVRSHGGAVTEGDEDAFSDLADLVLSLTARARGEGTQAGRADAAGRDGTEQPEDGRVSRREVDRLAGVLMNAWQDAEGSPVTVSYVATFADMARAVLTDLGARTEQQWGVLLPNGVYTTLTEEAALDLAGPEPGSGRAVTREHTTFSSHATEWTDSVARSQR